MQHSYADEVKKWRTNILIINLINYARVLYSLMCPRSFGSCGTSQQAAVKKKVPIFSLHSSISSKRKN